MKGIFAVCNQKGGVGKSTLTLNLGAALARMGVKVLCVDLDPQANLTMALGCQQPDELAVTLPTVLRDIIDNRTKPGVSPLIESREYILHAHGMDFVPSSIELSTLETSLINTISRETVRRLRTKCVRKHRLQLWNGYFRGVKVGAHFFRETRPEKIFLLPLTPLDLSLQILEIGIGQLNLQFTMI